MNKLIAMPLLLLLTACNPISVPVDYYDGRWDPPTVEKIEAAAQVGNVSGQTATISGAGFGTEAEKVLVQFGNRNAVITAITDGEITVVVPPGPVGGGDVAVLVGTYTGFASGTYTYEMGDDVLEGDGQGSEGQVGYVLVTNYWESCFGGLSPRLEETYGTGNFTDCQTFAYLGSTGITGAAEAIEFAAERLHAPSQGWSGAADLGDGEWRVERPGELAYFSGLEDFHVDLGTVTLTNEYWSDSDGYCVDLSETAAYRYGGGDPDYPDAVTLTGAGLPVVTDADEHGNCEEGRAYEADTLQFCQRDSSDGVPEYIYETDWPINEDFFENGKHSNQTKDHNLQPVDVELHLPDVGVDSVKLSLPEPLVVYNTEGFDEIFTDGTPGAQDVWSAYGTMQHCFDDDGRSEDLDDGALTFEWPVTDVEYSELEDPILGVRTYVRVSITELSLGWFGGINYPVRATITVPDELDTYRGTGPDGKQQTRSRLTIPASVMYQLPTIKFPAAGGLGGAGLVVQEADDHYGYMFIEVQRVTEYTIQTDKGPMVFAYVTGDFGFTEWVNPTDDACHNCEDDDGDGWVDDKDPDCAAGVEEVGTPGTTACADGVDNDGDGLTDAEDDACEGADDDDESNCDNGLDDDEDGLEDEDDADCIRGDNETTPDGCVDGEDNDGDGWTDAADPDCLLGIAEEGFGTAECNDNVDNDGDNLSDALDAECTAATDESELD